MTQHSADDLKVVRTTQKGDPDCASILFGIIRHYELNCHSFPEKRSASITCTFHKIVIYCSCQEASKWSLHLHLNFLSQPE